MGVFIDNIFFIFFISLSLCSLLSLFVHSHVIILYNCIYLCVYMCKCLYCVGAICEKCNADFFIYNGKMIIFISQMLTNNCVLYCVCMKVCCWIMLRWCWNFQLQFPKALNYANNLKNYYIEREAGAVAVAGG